MLWMGDSSFSGNGVLTVRCDGFYHACVRCRRAFLAGLAFVLLLLGACTHQGLGAGDPTGDPSPLQLPSSPEALPAVNIDSYRALLSTLHGTPVIVNIWASWCAPCQDEAPLLSAAATANPGVQFIGVDIQDSKDGAIGFIRRFSLPYPSLFDPSADIRNELGFLGQPDTLFYDADGHLQSQVSGPIDQQTLDREIAKFGGVSV